MRKIWFVFFGVLIIGLLGCNTAKSTDPAVIIDNTIELSVEPGEQWLGKMKVFIFSVSKTPQLAAWIEDGDGNYIATITVTNRSAKRNWRSAPAEGRPEALPIWNHRFQNNSAQNDVDTVSAATAKGAVDVQIANGSLINGHEYTVYLEINHSFDYNETYPENTTGVNGQPSVLYQAKFIAGQAGKISLLPIGRGSVDGSHGTITEGLTGLTTALEIIKNAYVSSW
ncbi:DUF2271 domain-containing protein [Treponema sp. TIM-1]|uniref:DUF2271 domain-containing protein n=1 Tax=Treponema sp. TIM-1 TaxID=2898417 RepID=UPI0039804E09